MFKGIGNIMTLMKEARNIGGKFQEISEKLKSKRAVGSGGGGLIEIEVNGLAEVLACRIDPSLMEKGDREMIEDLVVAAANDAASKAKQLHQEAMKDVTAGIELPGLDEALAKFTGGEGKEE